jgi:hypothetical protein
MFRLELMTGAVVANLRPNEPDSTFAGRGKVRIQPELDFILVLGKQGRGRRIGRCLWAGDSILDVEALLF